MTILPYQRITANEKSIEALHKDTQDWEHLFQNNTEEIFFLKELLLSDVFEKEIPNMYERLQQFYNRLDELKTEKIDLHTLLHNHKNDLNGMLECEDISCESFYYSQHQELADKIVTLFKKLSDLKLEIFRFARPLLRQNT